ncbi:MAG TPA: AIPR family protein, partial [Solimonas sp.]|nr:AIPR family protein [Solimonas sp.]
MDQEIVPSLPPLLKPSNVADNNAKKNRSRAFSAFALANLCGISKAEAAKAVVDDFDDFGVDAIYYHARFETLYVVQSKLKAADSFGQDEALAFCQGVRKLLKQELAEFNENVQKRTIEIEGALESCSKIKLVIAHTGSGISKHAKHAVDELLADEDHGEERLDGVVIDYDAVRVVEDLRGAKAYSKISTDLLVQKCEMVSEPRLTYFGLIPLSDLVNLHQKHDKALYERNIRTFLGHKTEVNGSIQKTLSTKPQDFLFLNNGVTVLCEEIEPKNVKAGRKRLKVRGLSVINGAQTIASSARFVKDNPQSDISSARVSLTLIKADADSDFGKQVTRARNHQNPVHFSNFAALDDEQERLRRDLAHLGIDYVYKAEAVDQAGDPNRIRIDEAAQALAILTSDPRYVVWLKKEPAQLLDTTSDRYKLLFGPSVTGFQLANAVRINRYLQQRMASEA